MAEQLSNDDVLRFLDTQPTSYPMVKVSEAIEGGLTLLHNKGSWYTEGMSCELLKASGGGWKKGKLIARLEFVFEEDNLTEPQDVITSEVIN